MSSICVFSVGMNAFHTSLDRGQDVLFSRSLLLYKFYKSRFFACKFSIMIIIFLLLLHCSVDCFQSVHVPILCSFRCDSDHPEIYVFQITEGYISGQPCFSAKGLCIFLLGF